MSQQLTVRKCRKCGIELNKQTQADYLRFSYRLICTNCYNKNINKEKVKVKDRKHNQKIRLDILNLLGNKCNICGFNDNRALQIDHVNSNGSKERSSLQTHAYYNHVLSEIKLGSNEYQLLCANCNWIKRYEKHEVRH